MSQRGRIGAPRTPSPHRGRRRVPPLLCAGARAAPSLAAARPAVRQADGAAGRPAATRRRPAAAILPPLTLAAAPRTGRLNLTRQCAGAGAARQPASPSRRRQDHPPPRRRAGRNGAAAGRLPACGHPPAAHPRGSAPHRAPQSHPAVRRRGVSTSLSVTLSTPSGSPTTAATRGAKRGGRPPRQTPAEGRLAPLQMPPIPSGHHASPRRAA